MMGCFCGDLRHGTLKIQSDVETDPQIPREFNLSVVSHPVPLWGFRNIWRRIVNGFKVGFGKGIVDLDLTICAEDAEKLGNWLVARAKEDIEPKIDTLYYARKLKDYGVEKPYDFSVLVQQIWLNMTNLSYGKIYLDLRGARDQDGYLEIPCWVDQFPKDQMTYYGLLSELEMELRDRGFKISLRVSQMKLPAEWLVSGKPTEEKTPSV